MTVHVLICGLGAVGGFYASRLHEVEDVQVSVICRSNYNAVVRNGLDLRTRNFGNYNFRPYQVYPSIEAAAKSSTIFDFVIVSTKALPDRTDDSEQISPLIKDPKTAIVLIQNGVGIERPHRLRFPKNPILSAVTIISAEQANGVLTQHRWTRISIGPYVDIDLDEETKKQKLSGASVNDLRLKGDRATKLLVDLFQKGGVKDAELYDEAGLQLVRWHKIAINGAFNPSSVLAGQVGNSFMVTDPELRIHCQGVMEEVMNTAPKILGKPFPSKLATSEQLIKSTSRNTGGVPSMLIDWKSNRPMELETIVGNPVRIARAKGYEMPRLQSLYALLKSAQLQREEQAKSKL